MYPSDDNVEEGHLSSGFDTTCGAWEVGDHLVTQTAVLIFSVATIWCPIHALWLSATGQYSVLVPSFWNHIDE